MLNPVRTNFIKTRVNLDKIYYRCGCGGGLLCENLISDTNKVLGIDMSKEAIEIAKAHRSLKNLKIDYEHISLDPIINNTEKKYDVLTCLELIEHVPDPEKLIKNCVEITESRADLFFSTLNRNLISFSYQL